MHRRPALLLMAGLPWAGSADAAASTASTSTAPAALPARGVSRRPLVFPQDFGAHPDTRIEWWYATGWLRATVAGEQDNTAPPDGGPLPAPDFGFQLTFFRSRTGVEAGHPSRFAAHQLLFAHAALTDLAGRRLLHDQRVARAGFGVADAAEGDTAVQLRRWRMQRSGPADNSRYQAQMDSEGAGFGLDLQLQASQPLLLQGLAGWSQKGPRPEQASHYYSQPQLRVSGSVLRQGRRQPVSGRAWLDHEWSNSLMAPDAVGWDWLGINLHDGGALTLFRLRRADGSSAYAGGSHRPAGGPLRQFGPDELVFQPLRHWTSPATQASYPVAWRLQTPLGVFELHALLDNQELDSRSSTGAVYWEGLSELRDPQGKRIGHGYLEMTGYVARLEL